MPAHSATALAILAVASLLRGMLPPASAIPAPATRSDGKDPKLLAVLNRLIDSDPAQTRQLLGLPVAQKDRRFIAPLFELLRASAPAKRAEIGKALDAIAGESLGGDWRGWYQWLGHRDVVPLPAEFATWKGELYARFIDPHLKRFLDSRRPTRVRVELVQWGGVKVDGIPSLDHPKFVSADEAKYLTPEERIFGVALHGDARAYPLRILDWHEMANDVVGGVAVSLAYCTLCGAGVLYKTSVDGTTYTFGTSGLLYESNKLMYDRQSDTLWNQLTGEAVNGPLAARGIELERLPIVVSQWKDWLALHPDTKVLSIATGFSRDYTPGRPYGAYFARPDTMFPVARRSRALPAKAQVFALLFAGTAKAYPLDRLAAQAVTQDTLAGRTIVLVNEPAGPTVRAYDCGNHSFLPTLHNEGGMPRLTERSTGSAWRLTEDALVGPSGETLPRLAGHLAYWFGWFSFYPRTLIYGIDPVAPEP